MALAVAAAGVVVAMAVVAMVVGHGSRDAFVGTWRAAGTESLVVTHVSGADYTVVVGGSHKARAALCNGDRLTIVPAAGPAPAASATGTGGAGATGAAASATTNAAASTAADGSSDTTLGATDAPADSSSGAIVLKPGPARGTLEECFADGTSAVLTRQ